MNGCHQHPLTDYRPLDQAGMWSSNVEQLKTLNTSDREVAQLVKLKQAGIGDDACVTLISGAHRSEEHTSELQSQSNIVCRLLLEKKKMRGSPLASTGHNQPEREKASCV